MTKLLINAFMILGVFLLAACSGQPSDQTLPTLIPSPAPPTETPIPSIVPSNAPIDRPTLPPTWTVSPVPSETPIATLDATLQMQLAAPTLVVCGGFMADRERTPTNYASGQPVTVYWSSVDTAARYRVSIVSETGTELYFDYALEPTYTFPANIFVRGGRYAWQVYPEDAINQQMCFERGGELLPPG
jgi:hypothetical protein